MQPGVAPKTLAELRAATEEEVIAAYDHRPGTTMVGADFYLNELARRAAATQGERIERLTKTMARLTWVIAVLTAVNAAAALVTTLVALKVLG